MLGRRGNAGRRSRRRIAAASEKEGEVIDAEVVTRRDG